MHDLVGPFDFISESSFTNRDFSIWATTVIVGTIQLGLLVCSIMDRYLLTLVGTTAAIVIVLQLDPLDLIMESSCTEWDLRSVTYWDFSILESSCTNGDFCSGATIVVVQTIQLGFLVCSGLDWDFTILIRTTSSIVFTIRLDPLDLNLESSCTDQDLSIGATTVVICTIQFGRWCVLERTGTFLY